MFNRLLFAAVLTARVSADEYVSKSTLPLLYCRVSAHRATNNPLVLAFALALAQVQLVHSPLLPTLTGIAPHHAPTYPSCEDLYSKLQPLSTLNPYVFFNDLNTSTVAGANASSSAYFNSFKMTTFPKETSSSFACNGTAASVLCQVCVCVCVCVCVRVCVCLCVCVCVCVCV
jgi:hypothetical protein